MSTLIYSNKLQGMTKVKEIPGLKVLEFTQKFVRNPERMIQWQADVKCVQVAFKNLIALQNHEVGLGVV